MQTSQVSRHFLPLISKYPPQQLVFKYIQPIFSRKVRDQVSNPYKTTGKTGKIKILIFVFSYRRLNGSKYS